MESLAYIRDLEKRLELHGLTPEGLRWVVKALHPACALDFQSLPDSSYMKTVRAEYRAQAVVSAPASEKWDLFIWRFPGDSTPVVYRSQAASTGPVALGTPGYININPLEVVSTTTNTFTSDTATYWLFATGTGLLDSGAGTSGQVSYVYPTSAYESFRHSYASITCYLTAAALSD